MSTIHQGTTEERLRKCIAEGLYVSELEVKPESHFSHDLGGDSIDLLETLMRVEDEFALDIPDEDAVQITTFQKALDYVAAKVPEKATAA